MTYWKDQTDWRARYSDLYKQRNSLSVTPGTEHRISFINDINDDIKSNIILSRIAIKNCEESKDDGNISYTTPRASDERNADISLLEMVRRSIDEGRADTIIEETFETTLETDTDKTLETIEKATDTMSDKTSIGCCSKRNSETCVHGLMIRQESSSNVSHSKISRKQPRDIDLTSILAFTTSFITPIANTIKNPEFVTVPKQEERPPQWSIRRSVCPVCSQKWRDKSSIAIVKSSGLKRNSSSDFPSVVAPARLRSAVISEYNPRPALAAVDKDAGIILGGWRLGNTSWELSRARKFRAPKPQPLPDIKIPATATHEKIDLDIRVNRFLSK